MTWSPGQSRRWIPRAELRTSIRRCDSAAVLLRCRPLDDEVIAEWSEIFPMYAQQEDFVTGSRRGSQLFCGGRGTGKTRALANKALALACMNPGRQRSDGSWVACPGAILGRTAREIVDKIEPYFEEDLRRFKEATGINLLARYNKALQRYTLINGAQIYKLSYGRSDSLAKVRGYTFAWACVDEIDHAEVDGAIALEIISATLRHPLALEPQFACCTTPDGMRGAIAHFATRQSAGDAEVYIQTATVYDNPYVDDRFRERLKAGCSPRRWQQEGLGKILRPSEVVFVDYDDSTHVIPWVWQRDLPYVLGIDWGEAHAYVCAIEVDPTDGTWVVAREHKMEDGSRPRFRQAIVRMVQDIGTPPYMIGSDRAVTEENGWLHATFGAGCPGGIMHFEKTDHQRRSWGIGAIASMLSPGDRDRPRLYLSSDLAAHLEMTGRGIRRAIAFYSYQKRRMETGELVVTNTPEFNTPNCHPCDALRYIVGVSVWDPYLHGGDALPYALAHSELDYAAA